MNRAQRTHDRFPVAALVLAVSGLLAACGSDPSGPGTPRVLEGDLTVSNPEELADFQRSGWTEISGDLRVGGTMSPLENLDGMESLRVVTGTLAVENTPSLRDISALAGLEEVGGRFTIRANQALEEVPALGELRSLGGLWIELNHELRHLGGFPALEAVDGSVRITENEGLEGLGAFPVLNRVDGHLNILDNASLLELEDFRALESVVGGLAVTGNSVLESLKIFPALTVVGGLSISENEGLQGVEGFPALATVEGDFVVHANGSLGGIPDFPALTVIGGDLVLDAMGREGVTVGGFTWLERIGGSLRILSNTRLGEISPFSNLHTVTNDIDIRWNDGFETLDWLPVVTSTVDDLLIVENWSLGDVVALSSLGTAGEGTRPAVRGNFSVVANPRLSRAQAEELAELLGVGGTVTITGSPER